MKLKNPLSLLGISLLVSLLMWSSCSSNSSDPFAKCKYQKPRAIFSDSLPPINSHTFEMRGTTGFESVQFKNGIALELIQSGCDEIKQEFRFSIPQKVEEDVPQFWLTQAAGLLNFLGNLSEQQRPLVMWGNLIEQSRTQMQLGEAFELDINTFAKVDRIPSAENPIILIELSTQ